MTPDPAVEVRAARADEADDLLRVLCAAFGLSFEAARPLFYRDPFFDLSHKRLLRTPQDGVLSCLTVIPSEIRVGASWVPLGGIAGVATRPDRQGQGWGGRLLAGTMPALAAELGYPLSGLFPAHVDFYRRFGWETASGAACRRGPASAVPVPEATSFVRQAMPDDAAAIRHLHGEETRTGTCRRDERRWRIIESSPPERGWAVYQAPGQPVTGYAVAEDTASRGGLTRHIWELRGRTPAARRDLLGFFAREAPPTTMLEWTTAEDEPELSCLPGETKSGTPLMLRLVDLPAALAAVHAANLAPVLADAKHTLTIHAHDPLQPENERPVRLTADGVRPGTDNDPNWIVADIRALAQAYLGYRTPAQLNDEGRLGVSSPSVLVLADALFPARHPFVPPLDQF